MPSFTKQIFPGKEAGKILKAFTDLIREVLGILANLLGRSAAANPRLRNFSVEVVRPDDLLVLTFEFQNLSPIDEGGANTRLVRKDPGEALIIVHFPPQSIVEEASKDDGAPGPELPIEARISGESRLVFRVPESILEIPFTLDALLDWSRYEPYLAPVAQPPPFRRSFGLDPRPRAITFNPRRRFSGGFFSPLRNFLSSIIGLGDRTPQIVRPDEFTALEIPYRLFLSPNQFNAWAHSPRVVEHGGRTELWHTRLGVAGSDAHPESPGRDNVDEYDSYYRTLRAIWTPVYPNPLPTPFPNLLPGSDDRRQLVALTADFNRTGCESRLINVDLLMLTSLGAWMNANYAFAHPKTAVSDPPTPPPLDLIEWRHRMTFGRDHYVRVVHQGYLFPFGHRAVLIEVSERKFEKTPDRSATAAYIRNRRFVVVQQPEKRFGASGLTTTDDGFSYDRKMPFKTVRITTLVTPDLNTPPDGPTGAIKGDKVFWIQTDNETDFRFHLIGTDEVGQTAEFSAPLIFVSGERAFGLNEANDVAVAFNAALNDSRRSYVLSGQKVAFAPLPDPDSAGAQKQSTIFETRTISMGVEIPDDDVLRAAGKSQANLISEDQPRFFPTIVEAEVGISAAQKLLGTDQRSTIRFNDVFLKNGFEVDNAGQVFAQVMNTPSLKFPADKSGGVVNPNFDITGLSRSLGPVGGQDLAAVANLTFKPAEFFPTLDAKILGSIALAEILKDSAPGDEGNFPKMLSSQLPDQITTTLDWKTSLLQKSGPFVPLTGAVLSIKTRSITHLPGGAAPPNPTMHVEGRLTNFQFNLFEMVIVRFSEFAFASDTGQKLSMKPDVAEVTFKGPLEFVNVLAELIPDSLGAGPSIDVSPTGIKVGYSVGLPMIGGGLFSIQHVNFSAGLNLPFISEPVRLRFAFSERHDPFMVSVYGITGGGFVGIAIGLDGVELLEASFEVGGSLALNLVVASGAVFIMLGIHFSWEKVSPGVERVALAGYIRAGGSVEVLGLVSVSIEFYMELGFISPPPIIHGEASLTVEVEIAFFSKSVTLSVEKDLPAP